MPQSKSPILEPHTQAFIDTLTAQGGEPLYKLSYPAARKLLEDLQAAPVAMLPAALIIVDENDVLRDECEAYTRKLIQAGVEVTALCALATYHDFAMLNPLAATPATRGAIRLAAYKLSEALSSAAEKSVAA